jgi:glucokinase
LLPAVSFCLWCGHASMDNSYYIGVDLGGTNTVAAVVDENHQICAKAKCKTKLGHSAEQIIEDICHVIQQAVEEGPCSMNQIRWIGIGTPGVANSETGQVDFAGSLLFHHVSLGREIENKFHLPTWICNDAKAAALGEWSYGLYKDCHLFALVTLGTGIGCGIIWDQMLYSGRNFAAGELGHMVVEANGVPCNCGRKGCFEQYASVTGLVRITKEYMQKAPDSFLWTLCEGDLKNVSGRTAFLGKKAGDSAACAVVEEYTSWLALGLTNLINLLQPDVICLGGGISNEGETLLVPVRQKIAEQEYSKNCLHRTKVIQASLKNDAGLIGAALFPMFEKENKKVGNM